MIWNSALHMLAAMLWEQVINIRYTISLIADGFATEERTPQLVQGDTGVCAAKLGLLTTTVVGPRGELYASLT